MDGLVGLVSSPAQHSISHPSWVRKSAAQLVAATGYSVILCCSTIKWWDERWNRPISLCTLKYEDQVQQNTVSGLYTEWSREETRQQRVRL